MDSLSKINHRQQPLRLSLDHHRALFAGPISSVSFRTPSSSSWPSSTRLSSIRASSEHFAPTPKTLKSPISPISATLKPLLKTTCVAIVAAALFLVGSSTLKPAYAEPTKESTEGVLAEEERERASEEHLESNPEDVNALKSLMEAKLKDKKLDEAIKIIERLIVVDPDEQEWPLLRAHTLIYAGDPKSAKLAFEELLADDPLLVEAHYGLVMAVAQLDEDLDGAMKRVEEAMERCKKEKKEAVRDFKLLIAQIRVMEGDYTGALKVYEELVKEEPRDFRPYLCQGVIYTLLRKRDEAEKQFEKYRRLVPKGHPYAEFFEDNMMAIKVLSQRADSKGAGLKS